MTYTSLSPQNNNQSGNILIYILGAIFLLGLLVVISKGSVTPGAGIDQETLMIRVSEIQAYGQELERAVGYVMANGHSEVDIRFAHPDADIAYGDITDVPSRQVFSREGGGATYRAPPEGIQVTPTDWVFSGENRIYKVGSSSNADSSAEILAVLPYVTKEFCLLINNSNDVPNPSNSPPQDAGNMDITTPFIGILQYTHGIWDATQYLEGKLEGCIEGDISPPAGTYHYYRVLLAR